MKGEVTFCAGNDPGQMMAAWLNWLRWGWEEHGVEINHGGAVQEWLAKSNDGTFLQIIGWDGVEPVAMVELRLIYDAMLDKKTCYGDHAYVHPDYRRAGLMTRMVDFCIETASLMDFHHWVVPVTAGQDAAAPWLRKVYEAAGFELTGITMARRPR